MTKNKKTTTTTTTVTTVTTDEPAHFLTHVLYILDESGSMGSIHNAVIDATNEYIGSLASHEQADYRVTIAKFDSRTPTIRELCHAAPLDRVPKLTEGNYTPTGMTPLYDAVCMAVGNLEREVQGLDVPVLVVIQTDGMENASREHTQSSLKLVVERLTRRGWTFTYLGANQDAWAVAQRFSIPVNNVATWTATAAGAAASSQTLAGQTNNYYNWSRSQGYGSTRGVTGFNVSGQAMGVAGANVHQAAVSSMDFFTGDAKPDGTITINPAATVTPVVTEITTNDPPKPHKKAKGLTHH